MNAQQVARVEWNEVRGDQGAVRVIAERDGAGWEFWEKDSWEVRWYPMESLPEHIAKAEELSRARGCRSRQAVAA